VDLGVIDEAGVRARIQIDSERYAFFSDMRDFCKELAVTEKFILESKAKEEQQAQLQAKKGNENIKFKKSPSRNGSSSSAKRRCFKLHKHSRGCEHYH